MLAGAFEYDERVIQDRTVPSLQELQLVNFRRTADGATEVAVVHRVHAEDDTVTLQFVPSQQRLRVHASYCEPAFQPVEFPAMHLAPGEKLPTVKEAFDHWAETRASPPAAAPPPPPQLGGGAQAPPPPGAPALRASGTAIFGDEAAPAAPPAPSAPSLKMSGTTLFGQAGSAQSTPRGEVGDVPPPPSDEEIPWAVRPWGAERNPFLRPSATVLLPPEVPFPRKPFDSVEEEAQGPPGAPPPMQAAGTTLFGGEVCGTKEDPGESPADAAIPSSIMASLIEERKKLFHEYKGQKIKTILEPRWGMPAPTQYALYRRGLPESQLSEAYGNHIYTNLYGGQRCAQPVEEIDIPDNYIPGSTTMNGKKIIEHVYVPLEGPSYQQAPTGHWVQEPQANLEYDYNQQQRGLLDGKLAGWDQSAAGFLDGWFDGLFD